MAWSSRWAPLSAPALLLGLAACQDVDSPTQAEPQRPSFAQSDNHTWTVNSLADPGDGICDEANCTLREAIGIARSVDGFTTILFQEGLTGVIPLASTLSLTDMSTTIDGDARIGIDGMDRVRIMRIRGDFPSTVTLKGLTLSGARAAHIDNSDEADQLGTGGAILAGGAGLDLHLENVRITDNHADGGGSALRVWQGATVTLRNSTVTRNTSNALSTGGALYSWGGDGSSNATLTVLGTTISDNSGGVGGGIVNWGRLTVMTSTISGNTGVMSAGGIYNGDIGTATITRSTISGNTGGSDQPDQGAGITNLGDLTLQSSTVTLNQQGGQGTGGVSRNTEFNSAPTRILNSIIAGNTGQTTADCLGTPTSQGYNLTTSGGGCSFSSTGDISVAGANLFTAVLEQALKNNGGITNTHALIPRGPAVDKGSCPSENADQRGSPRPDNDPGVTDAADGCDIGAYETVTPVADLWLSQKADKVQTKQGDLVTYSIQVRNYGPETAPAVVVTTTLSGDVAFVQATSKRGTITPPAPGQPGAVTWVLGDLANGARETSEIQVKILLKGKASITNTSTVTGRVADPSTANNAAGVTISVNPGGAVK